MRKVVFVLGMILFCLPSLSYAQGSPAIPGLLPIQMGQPLGTFSSPFAGLPGGFDLGNMTIRPWALAGYTRIGMNINIPSGVSDATIRESSADVRLKDDFWAGTAGLTVGFSQGFSLFMSIGANIPKGVTLFTDEEPYDGHSFNRNHPYAWKGSGLQWWTARGGIQYVLRPDVSLLAGLAYDQITVGLRDPIDDRGRVVNDTIPWGTQRWTLNEFGDVKAGFWLPFVGVLIDGGYYRAFLIAGPAVSMDLQMPFILLRRITDVADPTVLGRNYFGWVYKIKKPGAYLEGYLEYDLQPSALLGLKLWGGASWLAVRGQGEMQYQYYNVGTGGDIQPDPLRTGAGMSTYSRYTLSVGLAATLNF